MILQIGQKRKSKGIVFLEVMIAVSILSAALLIIIDTFFNSFFLLKKSECSFNASLIAEETMYRICLLRERDSSMEKDEIDFDGKRFLLETSIAEADSRLFKKAACRVYLTDRPRIDFKLTTFML